MLYVDTGCIVAFEDSVQYSVERIGGLNRAGIMNAVFGGEGLSQATLRGNGRVILQSMTIDALAKALEKNMGAGDKKTGAGLGGSSAAPRTDPGSSPAPLQDRQKFCCPGGPGDSLADRQSF